MLALRKGKLKRTLDGWTCLNFPFPPDKQGSQGGLQELHTFCPCYRLNSNQRQNGHKSSTNPSVHSSILKTKRRAELIQNELLTVCLFVSLIGYETDPNYPNHPNYPNYPNYPNHLGLFQTISVVLLGGSFTYRTPKCGTEQFVHCVQGGTTWWQFYLQDTQVWQSLVCTLCVGRYCLVVVLPTGHTSVVQYRVCTVCRVVLFGGSFTYRTPKCGTVQSVHCVQGGTAWWQFDLQDNKCFTVQFVHCVKVQYCLNTCTCTFYLQDSQVWCSLQCVHSVW